MLFFLGEVDWQYLDSLAETESLKLIKGVRARKWEGSPRQAAFQRPAPLGDLVLGILSIQPRFRKIAKPTLVHSA